MYEGGNGNMGGEPVRLCLQTFGMPLLLTSAHRMAKKDMSVGMSNTFICVTSFYLPAFVSLCLSFLRLSVFVSVLSEKGQHSDSRMMYCSVQL